jgi:hypothetical protein
VAYDVDAGQLRIKLYDLDGPPAGECRRRAEATP